MFAGFGLTEISGEGLLHSSLSIRREYLALEKGRKSLEKVPKESQWLLANLNEEQRETYAAQVATAINRVGKEAERLAGHTDYLAKNSC